ncbi:MAG: DUF4215 domain-containing protein [Deltaproteobacteria bacterium]|nr:DUF4215 domain-containing protein [Deltaproteobacteria bacterium]
MKRTWLALSCLAMAGAAAPVARAGDIRHTFAGDPTNSFYTDDAGGSVNNGGNDLSYYLNLGDVDQSAIGTLFVYANDGIAQRVDNGYAEQDFGGGSGIQLFELSALPLSSAAGEIGLADDSPLTPVSFVGGDTGLTVQQVTYTSDAPGDRFVIVEYRVVNNSTGAVTARIGLSNDFDVDLKSADARVGFDDSTGIPMVFQQEAPPLDPTNTTVGVGLMRGALAQHRLESCSGAFGSCQILEDADAERIAFFNGALGEAGDLTGGIPNQDFAVTIAANLGSIPPGEGRGAVFCYTLGQGNDAEEGLADCAQATQDCESFYEDNIAFCGNGLTNFGENCDDADTNINDACPSGPTGNCQPATCGDGFEWNQEGGTEQCDDGNAALNDSCPSGPSGTCQDATCGDGIVWDTDGGTEACDDGNANQNDACCACQPARCGDGFLWNEQGGTEQCDDGNNDLTDACPSGPAGTCRPAFCGDGFIRQGVEGCDDGNSAVNDACPSGPSGSCQLAFCGDGFVRQGVEVCDTAISGAACVNNCTSFDSCGDGNLDPGEACDDDNSNTSDACPSGNSGTCQNAACGDGFLRVGVEACDDGNLNNGDGCNASCQAEGPGGNPSTNPPGSICGNGIVEAGEQCDDGNLKDDDMCSSQCFPLPVLQGGATSTNSPLNPDGGGCSLGAGTSSFPSASGLGFLFAAAGLAAWRRKRA